MEALPPVVGFNGVAEAGFPDVMCPVMFLAGCNLRCPYCMNSSAVVRIEESSLKSASDVLDQIDQITDGDDDDPGQLLISGGEPCIHPGLPRLVDLAIDRGYRVRLSTNGTRPEVLETLLASGKLSFVALDIKLDVFGNKEIAGFDPDQVSLMRHAVPRSLELLKLHTRQNAVLFAYEVRTTLYPPLVDVAEIESISSHLDPNGVYVLQQFRHTKGMLSPGVAGLVTPYSTDRIEYMADVASIRLKHVHVRRP